MTRQEVFPRLELIENCSFAVLRNGKQWNGIAYKVGTILSRKRADPQTHAC